MAALRTKAELSLFGSTVFGTNEYPVDGGWRVFLVIALLFFVMMLFSGLYQLLETAGSWKVSTLKRNSIT